MENVKSGNRLFLCILTFYIGVSLLLRQVVDLTTLPVWLRLTLGEILMLVPTVLYLAVKKTNPFRFLPKGRLSVGTIFLLILFAYCMLPLVACVNAVSMLFQGNAVSDMMGTILSYPLPVAVLLIAVVPALCEEFVFRGVLYHTYRRQRIWPAVLISALFFGLMHLNFNQFCYAFLMGIFFALLIEATGSMWAPVIVHFTYNANSTVMTWLLGRTGYMEPLPSGTEQNMMSIMEESLAESGLSIGDPAAQLGIVLGFVIAGAVLLLLAAAGCFLAYLIYKAIARKYGRLEHVQILCSGKKRKALDERRLEAPQRVWTWEGIAAVLLAVAYIVWTW